MLIKICFSVNRLYVADVYKADLYENFHVDYVGKINECASYDCNPSLNVMTNININSNNMRL